MYKATTSHRQNDKLRKRYLASTVFMVRAGVICTDSLGSHLGESIHLPMYIRTDRRTNYALILLQNSIKPTQTSFNHAQNLVEGANSDQCSRGLVSY